jgi:predicted nucleic acid-binding protein
VDASVVAKWIIPGEPWEREALKLKEDIVIGDMEAYAPQLLLYEIASVISTSIRKGIMRFEDGLQALTRLKDLRINVLNTDWDDLTDILEISAKTGLTIYDSTYIQVSRKVDGALMTVDDELKRRGEETTRIVHLGEGSAPI